jgi:hypothetical protein
MNLLLFPNNEKEEEDENTTTESPRLRVVVALLGIISVLLLPRGDA